MNVGSDVGSLVGFLGVPDRADPSAISGLRGGCLKCRESRTGEMASDSKIDHALAFDLSPSGPKSRQFIHFSGLE